MNLKKTILSIFLIFPILSNANVNNKKLISDSLIIVGTVTGTISFLNMFSKENDTPRQRSIKSAKAFVFGVASAVSAATVFLLSLPETQRRKLSTFLK